MKIKLLTLGHCKYQTWERSLYQLQLTKSPNTELEHYFLYHYYPIDEENNKRQLKRIADENGLIWLDPGKNLGCTNGHNWAQDNHIHADYLMGYDPDSCPITNGWDEDLMKVISHPSIGWAALSSEGTPNELKERARLIHEETINGVECYICDVPMMLTCGIIKQSWVDTAGGMLPKTNYYGGTECYMWPYLKRAGLSLALLKNHFDTTTIKNETSDLVYHEWKRDHAHNANPDNFDEWLRKRNANLRI
jgi:hypothetical protein